MGAVALAASAMACEDERAPTEAERMAERLDRTAVHLHLSMREALEGEDGARVAADIAAAADSAERGDGLAARLFEQRDTGSRRLREGQAPTVALTELAASSDALPLATDQAGFFLALLLVEASASHEIPDEVLVYEATRVRPDAITDPWLAALAKASRALVMARGGYCETVGEGATPAATELSGAALPWLDAEPPREELIRHDLASTLAVVGGSARACCLMHDDDEAGAATVVAGFLEDAKRLGVSPEHVSIMSGWASLVRGDRAAAEERLTELEEGTIPVNEKPLYWLLRDALAGGNEQALHDASERLLDRRWLSAMALRAVHQAFERDGLLTTLEQRDDAQALYALAEGHAQVIESARARYPLFDQAHLGDRGIFERLAELFR